MDARQKRYTFLDGWRSISACPVVLFHCEINSRIDGLGFFRGEFLWMDFLRVERFVLIENHHDRSFRVFRSESFCSFVWAGLSAPRVRPGLVACKGVGTRRSVSRHAFCQSDVSFASLLANLLLVHSIGLFSRVTWNVPSWSISAEFAAYILFAAGTGLLGSKLWRAELAIVIMAPLVLASVHGDMNVTFDWGALRCVYGFGAGALCYRCIEHICAA